MITRTHLKILYSSWCILGFTRGKNSYDYSYNKDLKTNGKPYFYYQMFMMGAFGTLFYANPFTAPINIVKEIYRLEVNLRNLNDEKLTDLYNELF